MLNAIDARYRSAAPAERARLLALERRLTYDPRNIEDLSGPAQLRERLLDLISRMESSFQAPTAAQLDQAAAYRSDFDAVSTEYKRVMMVGP